MAHKLCTARTHNEPHAAWTWAQAQAHTDGRSETGGERRAERDGRKEGQARMEAEK